MWFCIGMLVGVVATLIISFSKLLTTARGTLKIDHSNPEKDLYLFEIDNLDELSKKKRILLNIDHDANLSQE